jgi:hypothetical protein
MKPIVKRLEEGKVRPTAVNETMTKLNDYAKKVDGLNHTMPWITDEQKANLVLNSHNLDPTHQQHYFLASRCRW